MKTLTLFLALLASIHAADTTVVVVGSKVSFFATAAGVNGAVVTPAPTFQWQKNGAPLSSSPMGATFVIESFAAMDVGDYTVVASNEFGSATSGVVSLQLGIAPATIDVKIIAEKPKTVTIQVQPGTKVLVAK